MKRLDKILKAKDIGILIIRRITESVVFLIVLLYVAMRAGL